MDGFPAVSCMCLTYGRPQVLEEAVESFVRQDYPGPKELLVLNDFADQTLTCNHPDVRIINVSKRFRTVGEKRNACAALASHDLLFVWDDDDIFLPHRLGYSVRMLDPHKGFFKPSQAFTLNNGVLGGPTANLFHSGACFTRQLFDRAHGYAHMGSGQDMDLELALEKIIGKGKNFNGIAPADIYYLYRWGGTGTFHLSGFGRDQPGATTGNDKVELFVRKQIDAGRVPTGEIELRPRWCRDYVAMARDYVTALVRAQPTRGAERR